MIAEKKDGAISFIGYDTENNGKFIVENGSLNSDWTYVNYQIDGKNTHLGRFDYEDLDKAGKFAEEMRQKYYGEFAGNN